MKKVIYTALVVSCTCCLTTEGTEKKDSASDYVVNEHLSASARSRVKRMNPEDRVRFMKSLKGLNKGDIEFYGSAIAAQYVSGAEDSTFGHSEEQKEIVAGVVQRGVEDGTIDPNDVPEVAAAMQEMYFCRKQGTRSALPKSSSDGDSSLSRINNADDSVPQANNGREYFGCLEVILSCLNGCIDTMSSCWKWMLGKED